MAYTVTWNNTTPADSDLASQGDDRIRELKIAIDERMLTVFTNWPAGDPLTPTAAFIPDEVTVGTLAARPNPPASANLVYYARDVDQLFVSVVDGATFEWIEVKPASTSEDVVLAVSAGEARFAPLGTETAATKVKNAILSAAASTSPVKTVFVPRTLWGYVASGDFNVSMFNTSVFLVREGSWWGAYDPVAYGADITGTTNSQVCIDTAYLHASTAPAVAGGYGIRLVAFTVPGTYLMTTDVDQRGVPQYLGDDVTISGGGVFIGVRPWKWPEPLGATAGTAAARPATGVKEGEFYYANDTRRLSIWNTAETPDAWGDVNSIPYVEAFSYNPAGVAGSLATAVVLKRALHLKIPPTTTSGAGALTVDLADASFGGRYDAAKIHTIVASERGADGDANEPARVSVAGQVITLELDGGSQTGEWDLLITFIP